MYKYKEVEYILIGGGALYRCDNLKKELGRMVYGKGWNKMDRQDYFMFICGFLMNNSDSYVRISEEKAIEITLSMGGSINQFVM